MTTVRIGMAVEVEHWLIAEKCLAMQIRLQFYFVLSIAAEQDMQLIYFFC